MWGRRVLPTTLPAPFSTTLSPALSVYLCGTVGRQGPLAVGLPAPLIPHSASLCPARLLESSLTRACLAPPTGLDECLFFISLVSDFLAVRFSVSSGCARRHSVSIYASILVLPANMFYTYWEYHKGHFVTAAIIMTYKYRHLGLGSQCSGEQTLDWG